MFHDSRVKICRLTYLTYCDCTVYLKLSRHITHQLSFSLSCSTFGRVLCVCLSVCLSVCITIALCVCPSVFLFGYLFRSQSESLSISLYLSSCLSPPLRLFPMQHPIARNLRLCLAVFLRVCPSVCLYFVCMSDSFFVHLSVSFFLSLSLSLSLLSLCNYIMFLLNYSPSRDNGFSTGYFKHFVASPYNHSWWHGKEGNLPGSLEKPFVCNQLRTIAYVYFSR